MKKIYMTPEVEVMELHRVNIVTQSPTIGDGNIDPSLPNLGRNRWDDDEDDE